MFKSRRNRIGLTVIAALSVHFTLTFMYTAPPEIVGNKAWERSSIYVGPIAHQYWRLFAPDVPKDNHRLTYRYMTKDGIWSTKIDPYEEYFEVHRRMRITWHGKICLAIYNLGYGIEREYSEADNGAVDWKSTTEWYGATFFCRKHAELMFDVEVVALKAQLEVVYPDGEFIVIELPKWIQ